MLLYAGTICSVIRLLALLVVIVGAAPFVLANTGSEFKRLGRNAPSQQTLNACKGKSEGDVCRFVRYRREVKGTCRVSPKGKKPLVCIRTRPESPQK